MGDKRLLLIGSGYSAATYLLQLGELKRSSPETKLHWFVRSSEEYPILRKENDPLPARDQLGKQANRLAKSNKGNLIGGTEVDRVGITEERMKVVFLDERSLEVDRIISNVGYRPDRTLYRVLQFNECYGTDGPMDLAANLLAQDGADCLDVESGVSDVLVNLEPQFYVLEIKSYGRKSNLLLENGFEQVSDLFNSDLLP